MGTSPNAAIPGGGALRLINTGVDAAPPVSPQGNTDARRVWAVASENIAAAGLAATDARWVLALRVAETLEGGRAAILRPDRRERLLRIASTMGLRAFDANLVIAIVQDAARSGDAPLGRATEQRLALVRPPDWQTRLAAAPQRQLALRIAAAAALAIALFTMLVRWLAG